MKYKISISKRAETNLFAILKYLKNEWSEKVEADFKLKLLKQIDFLRENPFMFSVSENKKDVRKVVITKHNILYCKINKLEVEIITIHDTRRNPKVLKI